MAKVAPPEPAAVQPAKPIKKALAAVPDDEPENEEPEADEPEGDEPEKDADEKDQFDVLLLPIIIIVLIVAGIIIFREKILALFERMKGGQPPAYGVPDYVA